MASWSRAIAEPGPPFAARTALAFLAVLLPAFALAQGGWALLEGTLRDPSGAAVVGAKLSLVSESTAERRQAVTNERGSFVVNFLTPGEYSVLLEHPGFRTVNIEKLILRVGETRTLDLRLEPTQFAETVEAGEETASVNRFAPELGIVVSARQLRELPLNGRQWTSLMALAPGAVNTGSGDQGSIGFFGRATNDNNWTFDGVDATGIRTQIQDTTPRLLVSMDAISEFRVSTALYSAAAGSAAGANIQLVSRSGMRKLRGTAYDYFRNNAFDEPPFGTSGPAPPLQWNQFGASLGGPLGSHRTFYFLSYEGLRQDQTERWTGPVPSASFRSGVAAVSPALVPIVEAYPRGTESQGPDVDRAFSDLPVTANENFFLIRVDHHFSDRTSMFVRFNTDRAHFENPQDTVLSPSDTVWAAGPALEHKSQNPAQLVAQFQHAFSSTLVSSFRVGVNRTDSRSETKGYFDVPLRVPEFTALNQNGRASETDTSISLIEDVALTRGNHNLRFGAEVRSVRLKLSSEGKGWLIYTSRADFMANRLNTATLDRSPARDLRQMRFTGYLQDDIKLKLNLTANVGLRYEYYSVLNDPSGQARVFTLSCGGFCPPGTPFYQPDWNNLAPRLGLNWAPAALNYRTVLRAGYGLYFTPGNLADLQGPAGNIGQHVRLDRGNAPGLSYPIDPFVGADRQGGQSAVAIDPRRRDAYVEQYGVSVQQQLGHGFALQVGFLGSRGHNLYSRTYLNVIDPITHQRPLPAFSRVDLRDSQGRSVFRGVHFSLWREFKNGLSLGADYLWGHSRDNGSVGAGDASPPQNVSDRGAEWARSTRDIRHSATLHWIYELPFGEGRALFSGRGALSQILGGWQLSGIMQARSGQPVNVRTSRNSIDVPDGNSSFQRPNRVPGVPLDPPGGQTPEHWINPAAFSTPLKGQWGDAQRNVAEGPGLFQVDVALSRRFGLSASRSLELRWEIFNVFNRTQLGNPENYISAGPSFGQITQPLNLTLGTGTSRQMQLMLRANF